MPDESISGKAGAIWHEEENFPLRSWGEVVSALTSVSGRRVTLLTYRDECARIADHHGVQDASSDLRELDAAEAALRWVLGERETLGY